MSSVHSFKRYSLSLILAGHVRLNWKPPQHADTAVDSQYPSMRNSWSMRSGNTEQSGQFVAQENSLGLSMMWLSEIWRRLMICGQNQPCLLVWVSIHSKIRLDTYRRWRVMFHIGNVSGGCWVNPWPKTNSLLGEALFCDNALPTRSRWCSNYHNWRNMRGLSSDSMCQIVWHDIVRRMAWFVSGA